MNNANFKGSCRLLRQSNFSQLHTPKWFKVFCRLRIANTENFNPAMIVAHRPTLKSGSSEKLLDLLRGHRLTPSRKSVNKSAFEAKLCVSRN